MYANLKNKLKVLNKSYTFYNTDPKGISSKYKNLVNLVGKEMKHLIIFNICIVS